MPESPSSSSVSEARKYSFEYMSSWRKMSQSADGDSPTSVRSRSRGVQMKLRIPNTKDTMPHARYVMTPATELRWYHGTEKNFGISSSLARIPSEYMQKRRCVTDVPAIWIIREIREINQAVAYIKLILDWFLDDRGEVVYKQEACKTP
jgi:hypothetical protein